MKRLIITFLSMMALVAITGRAFAQIDQAPVIGVAYDYTVTGIDPGNSGYVFNVNTSTTTAGDPLDGATINSGISGSAVGGTTTPVVNITWTATGTYNFWIEVTGTATGTCTNYRYIPMSPMENDFDASIIALGTVTATGGRTEDCPDPYGAVYDVDGTEDDGDTYLYYYVALEDANKSHDWKALVDVDGATNEQYSLDGSSGWTDMDAAVNFDTASETHFWVRVSVPVGTTQVAYDASLTASECMNTACSKEATDSNGTNDNASFNLNPVPDLSGISFN